MRRVAIDGKEGPFRLLGRQRLSVRLLPLKRKNRRGMVARLAARDGASSLIKVKKVGLGCRTGCLSTAKRREFSFCRPLGRVEGAACGYCRSSAKISSLMRSF